MGNSQSLFYPDNPNRRKRAQQLADDCEAFKRDYEKIKAEVEKELGPYKEKVYRVMNAFGCRNLGDLDRLVQRTAVGESLQQWTRIKSTVDDLDMASSVFSTAMAVVAIAGIAISIVGALAGGFGFFVGLAVTSEILLVMGILGAIFDAVSGAIQRSQLRDAINSLYPARIKIKYLLEHSRLIQINVSGIKNIYAIFEKTGYDRDAIIRELQESDVLQNLQQSSAATTYYEVAKGLVEHDRTRPGGAWTDEDPGWHRIAQSLDAELAARKPAASSTPRPSANSSFIPGLGYPVSAISVWPNDQPCVQRYPEMQECDQSLDRLKHMKENHMEYVPPARNPEFYDSRIRIALKPKGPTELSPLLTRSLSLNLKSFVDEASAIIDLETIASDPIQASIAQRSITVGQPTNWIISFMNPAEASHFVSAPDKLPSFVEVSIRVDSSDKLYLAADGSLTTYMQDSKNTFVVSYA